MSLSPKIGLPFNISRVEVYEQLERILISRTFRGSPRLRGVLKYMVDSMFEGEDARLKEHRIAQEVFGRTEAFDPKIDSIVRVQACRLRARLNAYFEKEGGSDCLVIDLPRGRYLPAIKRAGDGRPPSKPPSSSPIEMSVAVLPFLNLNGDKQSKLLCDGLTEELIDALTDADWVRVCARTAVLRFKDHREDMLQIAKELKVSALIEGSVRKLGDRLRASIRLIHAINGFSQRLGVYTLRLKSALAAQQMISRLIVADLAVHLISNSHRGMPPSNAADDRSAAEPQPNKKQSSASPQFV